MKGNSVTLLPDGSKLLFDKNSSSIMVVEADGIATAYTESAEQPHTALKDTETIGSMPWSPWGENDNRPMEMLETLGKLTVGKAALDTVSDMHFGAGLVWIKDKYKKGKVLRKVKKIPDWVSFAKKTEYNIQQSIVISSLSTFFIAFTEVILTKDRKSVYSVRNLDTPFCRYKKKDSKGRISHIYYSSKFGNGATEKDCTKIPLFDKENPTKHGKFVFVSAYNCFGKMYYPEPNYYASFRNGWVDIAISIPKMIKNIYDNQINLKYIIRLPLSTIRAKYSDYDRLEQKEQLAIQLKMKEDIETNLAAAENAGKSIMLIHDDYDEKIEVEPVKSFLDSSKELPNSAAGVQEFLFSVGVDPAMVGHGTPGGKNLSGSGSDKRESRQSKQANLKRERLVSLRLPNALAQFFDIDDDIYPTYMDTDTSQTVDENPTGKQNVIG